MKNNTYCVIMAGGIGSRFWPISRSAKPKQFLDILNTGKTFIQHTFERFSGLVPVENFLVVANSWHKDLVLEQLPMLKPGQVLCEPLGRNTAPCIAYAAFRLRATDPDATMIVTPADHLILDKETFINIAREAVDFAAQGDYLTTIGVKPTRPATGYGYIQVEMPIKHDGINKVKTFTEKPDKALAEVFVRSGEFFWNSGIFVWSVKSILKAFQKLLPDTYSLFDSIEGCYGSQTEQQSIDRIYPESRGISIDYGIMEKADNVYVRCGDFGWSDIGTWGSLYHYSPKDEDGNTGGDNVMAYDTRNCMLKLPQDKVAVIEGLENYIVVDTSDVLMICPRENEQNVKKFVEDVKFKKGDQHV